MEGLTCVLLTNQFWSIASEERRVRMISFMINSVKGVFSFGGGGRGGHEESLMAGLACFHTANKI